MKRRNRLSRPVGRIGDNRGLILPLVLMAFVVLGALSAALLAIGSSEVQIASNHLHSVQADFLAEAGLEHAYNWLRADTNRMTNPTTLYNSQLGGAGSAVGGYFVLYQAAGANTVRVVSTGLSSVGGSQKIRRAIMSTSFVSNDAILTEGPLTFSGNPDVSSVGGQCGNVHTNGNLTVSGNPDIAGNATNSGAFNVSGNPDVAGDFDAEPEPEKTIPVINPTNFLNAATTSLDASQVFQMKANGQILNGAGTQIGDLSSGGSYCGWSYSAGTPLAQWQLGGNTSCNGTYFLEGNAKVSGNPGESTPWVTTLIATGDIEISGNPEIQTALTDTLFVAGLDLKISGNPQNGFNGLMAAHEQFSLSGNPTINGFLIAEDASASSNTVIANTISGNPTITYSCGLNPPLQGPLQILSWGL